MIGFVVFFLCFSLTSAYCNQSLVCDDFLMTCDPPYVCQLTAGQTTGVCCDNSVTTARPIGPSSRCVDKMGPRGQNDCTKMAHLCNDDVYYDVMSQQCPLTCNRCSNIPTVPMGCADRSSPTGSECQKRKSLCTDPIYFDVMTRECPKTCDRCGMTSTTRSFGK